TREVLTARDWPTWKTSAKSINQLSPPETDRREQLLATKTGRHEAMASPKYSKTQGKFSPPETGRHGKLQHTFAVVTPRQGVTGHVI
ncbi:905_t:CDS:2, partial [Funneliformis geosporum]